MAFSYQSQSWKKDDCGYLWYLHSQWRRRSSTSFAQKQLKEPKVYSLEITHFSWYVGKHGLSIATCDIICSTSSRLRAENHYLAQLFCFTKVHSKSGSILIRKLRSYLLYKPQLSARMPAFYQTAQLIFSCRAQEH